jgi:hypothetical protein
MQIVSSVIEVLPFEFPGIRRGEAAVGISLIKTPSQLGFGLGPNLGPMATGFVAQRTDTLQTGLLEVCLRTGGSVIAGLSYSSRQPVGSARLRLHQDRIDLRIHHMQRTFAGQRPCHFFPTALGHLCHRCCGVVCGVRRQDDVVQA